MTVARMLSGRYLTDRLQRHWTENREGFCILPVCAHSQFPGTLEHLLLYCPSLAKCRDRQLQLSSRVALEHPALAYILNSVLHDPDHSSLVQLLLDCTSMPSVILTTQVYGHIIQKRLLYLGRTWCYNIHRERMNLLDLVKFR